MSPPSAITSPRLTPMRKVIRCSSAMSALRSTIARCTSTAQRTASTTLWKFHQYSVAGGLDDPAVVFLNLWIEQLAAMRFEAFVGPLLVRSHQPRIACDIGGEDPPEVALCRNLRGIKR